MANELRPFQREAVSKMVDFLKVRRGVYNACQMGLGKSVQAIETCNRLQAKRVLIVCPAVMCLVWQDEINKWANYILTDPLSKTHYEMYSYNKASQTNMCSDLASQHWDVLICDEAHYLKTRDAKRTRAVLQSILPACTKVIFLSGTPFTQSVVDCWSTFSICAPEEPTFKKYWDFARSYTHVRQTPFGIKCEGVQNADKLKSIIRSKFFIRYAKEDVLKELPEKQYQEIHLPKTFKVQYDDAVEAATIEYIAAMQRAYAHGGLPSVAPKAVATIRRDQGIKKVPAIVEFSQNLLDSDTPVVLFAYHKAVIAKLADALVKYGPVVITGETPPTERKLAVDRFQRGDTTLFIGNIVAAGVGITLTASSTVVLAELDWSPANVAQAIDRVHRIGQRNQVSVYYFTVQDSIDEKINDTVIEKAKTFNKILKDDAA